MKHPVFGSGPVNGELNDYLKESAAKRRAADAAEKAAEASQAVACAPCDHCGRTSPCAPCLGLAAFLATTAERARLALGKSGGQFPRVVADCGCIYCRTVMKHADLVYVDGEAVVLPGGHPLYAADAAPEA